MRIITLKFIILLLLLIFYSPLPVSAAGASLYFTPSTGTYVIGSKFAVAVKVNSGEQEINSAEGTISYDSSLLEAVSVSKGGSIFMFWPVEPSFSGGSIRFGGGRPGPYKGTAGHIITVTFKAKKAGRAQIRFTSGAVLAHDGKGTNILASMGSGSYTVSPQVTAPGKKKEAITAEKKSAKPAEREYNKPVITSPTHPDQNAWYNKEKALFKWDLPDGIRGVSVKFDQNPLAEPNSIADGLFEEKEYTISKDGVWYLHLKFKDAKHWGTTAHYRVMVDTVPPLPFKIEVEKIAAGEWPKLHFQTKDNESGLKQYEVTVGSLRAQAKIVKAEENQFQVSGLEVGEHVAIVTAVDRAGNETLEKVVFTVEPIEAPVITDYAREIKSSDKFFMSGTSLPDVVINIYIQKGDKLLALDSVRSDNGGNWFYLKKDGLDNGRYAAWAEAVNSKGIKSKFSAKVSFLVSPPIFARFGTFVIHYFTVFVSLLFMVIVVILLILFLAGLIRKKLKKETIEVEDVLRKNLTDLAKTVSRELKAVDKAAGKHNYVEERNKAEERLRKNIKETEKKIMKEIKDVEEILK